ncbi:MAG: tryptophan 7-halogenase [Vicinamibacterales bacterium]
MLPVDNDRPKRRGKKKVPRGQSPAVFDACVVGAGPAGAAAAALLARWGCSVIMVHRPVRQRGLAESLPASSQKLFHFLGMLDCVEARGFQPNFGNVSEWAGEVTVTRSDVPGYHVDRDVFDAALRSFAGSCGVQEIQGAVRRVTLGEPIGIDCDEGGVLKTYRSRFVLDCSGRAGVVGRPLFGRRMAGYRTLALIAEWSTDGWPSAESMHTFIESYADGWAWSVPLSAERRQCTVMIDPRLSPRAGTGLAQKYAVELAKARGFRDRLSSARQTSSPWSCDATVYESARTAESGVVLVGDAASFVEPLSSAGVRKALVSAWRAAVVVNTSIRHSSMWSVAADYFDRRERFMYSTCLRRAGAFFSDATREYEHEFWQMRERATSTLLSEQSGPGAVDDSPETDADVQAAFERLRRASASVRFVPGSKLRFANAPEIEGNELVMREAILMPGASSPTVFAKGANLAALTRIAMDAQGVGGVMAQYEAQVGRVSARHLLAGLSLLLAKRVLIQRESKPGRAGSRPSVSG